jgi:hypothetical protein
MKDIKTDKWKDRKQKDRQTDRQTERQEGQKNRKTGRHKRLKVIENKNSKSLLLKVRLLLQWRNRETNRDRRTEKQTFTHNITDKTER